MRMKRERVKRVLSLETRGEACHIKREGLRIEAGLTHIDHHFAIGHRLKRNQSSRDLCPQGVTRRQFLLMDKLHEATRAVTAVLDFAAVGIENPVPEVRLGMRGVFDQ